ncbi:AAA family ATPase [Candidatus Bathyarchaeota archaeon]|nr:MAG: AAA family ATPase [Candidatus Bathyarchaeota archaeon]TMI44827.1 MAG: AAA family ATPase [Candidatus Bathyarchaeota archaeon]
MSASEELESLAVKYAKEAIELERKGSKKLAATKYQRAIEVLLKLCSLYPAAPQNKVYTEHVEAYKKRIQELQSDEPMAHPIDSTETRDSKTIKLDQWVLTEKPDISWSDIADLERPKRAIEESIIFPVRRPDLFPLGWPRGILFFGPPGCGKTLLAAAIASEIKGMFFCADAASLMSKWLGESERNVSQLFTKAREVSENGQPAIVFIDEIDSLMGVRGEEVGGEVRVRNQFLKEMDGILDKNKKFHVYLIGATNKPWVLDEPFIRRFQKRIYVPLPDVKARMDMFQIYSQNLKFQNNVDFAELARRTEGYSGGDIRDLFQSTQIKVVRDFFQRGAANDLNAIPDPITMEDFETIITGRRPSVSQNIIKRYYDWDESFKAS